ncbi:hypothetical protein LIER_34255 [Lithospermum erythrorhizon]|uniref:DYW domain-containing protein n=1 Tax=Lithospermum erythrorhizon TaxID=34254 RepID=A0AAV3S0G1_LITER
MLWNGIQPNSYTFPFVFKCCGKIGGGGIGRQVHGHVMKFGLQDDVFVHTSIIHMYAKKGDLDSARLAFDKRGSRDAVSFTALINGYVSGGRFDDARKLFDEIPDKDVVSWNAIISGFSQMGRFDEALGLFEEMREEGVSPDVSTLLSVLSACAHVGALDVGNWARSWIEECGLGSNLRLTNALIDMYAKCGDLITARMLFDGIDEKDLISWNVMIGGYTHTSKFKEALDVFRLMQMENVKPNDVTFLSVLPACAHLGALALGKWIHVYIDKHRDSFTNPALWTSLISLYAKCGNIAAAKQVFNEIDSVTLGSWNVMISGLAMHGDAKEALALFSEMIDKGFTPDGITFISILSACSHAGLVDLGRQWFNSMVQEYNIAPKLQHYGCMIDLLGRAGLFDEAMALIESMDMEPDGAIWGSLLGACRIHGNLELGKSVADKLFKLEPNNPGGYVLLSNMYAQDGQWDEVARIRTMLNDMGMKKLPGCTSIEVDSVVHEFLVSDKTHPQSEDIYKMLDEMSRLLEKAGHVPDTSEVFYDIEEKWKEGVVSQHSEMLAISYGLISTKPGTTLRIVKNLRVCNNCHTATRLISSIFKREIIARDRNRFHHFKDGSCSCMDYW